VRRAFVFVAAAPIAMSIAPIAMSIAACSSSSDGSSSGDDSSTPIDSSSDQGVVDSFVGETASEVATDGPSETSSETASETSDATDGGACNDLVVPPTVDEVQVASAAPTMTGGTIPDGTWQLSSSQKFTGTGGASGPDGISLGQTLVFAGGATVQSVATAFGVNARWNADYSAGGTDLALKPSCGTILGGGSATVIFKYTASATELQIFVEAQGILETFSLK
jgi:hypothetical protein